VLEVRVAMVGARDGGCGAAWQGRFVVLAFHRTVSRCRVM
jgi:hypothetical protein